MTLIAPPLSFSLSNKLTHYLVFIVLMVFLTCSAQASSLKRDENVILFPTTVHQLANGQCEIPIHAWVFEPEKDSIRVKLSLRSIGELMEQAGLSDEQVKSTTFRERLSWFLVDNERNKELKVSINNQTFELNPTSPNGHSYSHIITPCEISKGNKIHYKLHLPANDKRNFEGNSQVIPDKGITVISDIDDTIKISQVLDKKALIRSTFANPFQVTPGMPEFYRRLKSKGYYFHYVSASPWQLYPSLKPFMDENYPAGSLSLRQFRVTDSSIISFLQSSEQYKLKAIRAIIERYPKHKYILIGDNGEHDPDVYQRIAQEFPKKIKAIYIREVTEKKPPTDKFQLIAKNRAILWKYFKHPKELK